MNLRPAAPNPIPTPTPEPGILNSDTGGDTPMTSTYLQVLVLEALIIAGLWIFGRMFA